MKPFSTKDKEPTHEPTAEQKAAEQNKPVADTKTPEQKAAEQRAMTGPSDEQKQKEKTQDLNRDAHQDSSTDHPESRAPALAAEHSVVVPMLDRDTTKPNLQQSGTKGEPSGTGQLDSPANIGPTQVDEKGQFRKAQNRSNEKPLSQLSDSEREEKQREQEKEAQKQKEKDEELVLVNLREAITINGKRYGPGRDIPVPQGAYDTFKHALA